MGSVKGSLLSHFSLLTPAKLEDSRMYLLNTKILKPPSLLSPSELFDNYMQQDAHEFLNYLLNTIADLLQEERKQEKTNGRLANGTLDSQNNNSNAPPAPTWVHEIFQGTLTNETRCLTCETVRFLTAASKRRDLSDIHQISFYLIHKLKSCSC